MRREERFMIKPVTGGNLDGFLQKASAFGAAGGGMTVFPGLVRAALLTNAKIAEDAKVRKI